MGNGLSGTKTSTQLRPDTSYQQPALSFKELLTNITPEKAQSLLRQSLQPEYATQENMQEIRNSIFLQAAYENPGVPVDELMPADCCQALEQARGNTVLLLLRDTLAASSVDDCLPNADGSLRVVTQRKITLDELGGMLDLFPYKTLVQSISFQDLVLSKYDEREKACHDCDWRVNLSQFPALKKLDLRGMQTTFQNMKDLFAGIDDPTARQIETLMVDEAMLVSEKGDTIPLARFTLLSVALAN